MSVYMSKFESWSNMNNFSKCLKPLLRIFVLFVSWPAFSQEDSPVVGKHVASNMDATSMILSLLMVLILIFVSALVLKRFQPQIKYAQGLKVVTSLHLGPKEKLIVVQMGDKQLLLGVTAHQVTLIDTLDEPLEVGSPVTAEMGQSFLQLFNRKNVTNQSPAQHTSDKTAASSTLHSKE